ncbi:MAG: methionine adenosyltransferase [Actinomycetota bacterium]|nr:methionine adenosyltransferase [Actinomycetota bacterium]
MLFTSESVTEGHPDKVADQISDAILDSMLIKDPMARVACEVFLVTGLAIIGGEITTSTYVEIPEIVRKTIRDIGYTRAKYGFDGDTCGVLTSIDPQSPDIAQGVDRALESRCGANKEDEYAAMGAGDQGMMVGYACTETDVLMPMPIMLAHGLAKEVARVRKERIIPYLRPDGKTQVTLEYEGDKPVRVETIVISAQHKEDVDIKKTMTPDLIEHVIKPIIPLHLIDYKKVNILVNPTGKFVRGGPLADTGLTGRKIIVDTYGGAARTGGGCFSGKDPTKVDRSAHYAARYVAKNVVAAGLADRCEVQFAYAIGVACPVSIMVECFGTEKIDPAKVERIVETCFDLRPAAIIDKLDLRRPIYKKTAAYGHFGREDADFTWERTDMVEKIKKEAGI